jgi:hypothetical protein
MIHKKLTIASAFLLAALTPQLQAQYYDWLGTTSDDWSDSSNWQDGATLGADDTARIFNSDISSDPTPNNTVLKTGDSVTLTRVWIGNSNDANESGVLTVESGASLSTSGDFVLENNSTLTSSGAISVGNGNGMILRDNSNLTLMDGGTLNKILLEQNSTATLEAGSSVTTISNINNSAQLTLNTSYTGNMFNGSDSSLIVNGTVNGNVFAASNSSITVNGTLNGNFGNASTSMQNIGANGTVNGAVEIDNDDQMTVAGSVNGRFFIKSSAQVTIEPTANVLSNHNNSWIYNTPSVTWKVGADGSIATLKTSRLEQNAGQYDGEWRYDNSAVDMVVDLTDCVVYGSNITLQLVSGIQNEATFASNVTFLLNGADVTADFAWDGAGTGSFTGALANPDPDADGDGLADSVETGTGIFVDATDTGTDPNLIDTDGDGLSDAAETGTGIYVSVTDTGTNPNLLDSDSDGLSDDAETGTGVYVSATDTGSDPNATDSDADGMSDFDEIQYMGLNPNVDSTSLIGTLPSTGGGIEQSVYDAAVAAQATAETALANAREARPGSTVIDVADDLADITLRVEQTSDVSDWSSATTSDHTIQLSAPAGASFYRFTIPE